MPPLKDPCWLTIDPKTERIQRVLSDVRVAVTKEQVQECLRAVGGALSISKGLVYARRGHHDIARADASSTAFDHAMGELRAAYEHLRRQEVRMASKRHLHQTAGAAYTRSRKEYEATHHCYGCWTAFPDPTVLNVHMLGSTRCIGKHMAHLEKQGLMCA